MSIRNLEYSRLEDHNRHRQTDMLYDPLRSILMHPGHIPSHSQYVQPAAMQSRVTHDYAYLNP